MEEHDNDVGKHDWVEDKNWWKDHAPDMDVSSMTHKQKKEYTKMIEEKENNLARRCEKHPEDEKCQISLTKIQENLAH